MYNNEELLEYFNIPIINNGRQYWLVRTDGGNLWEQFKAEGFIGIGWNEFSDSNKFLHIDENKELEKQIRESIRNEYKVDKPGLIINSIKRFSVQMKIGDIVMIPSSSSNIISFGEIVSDLYLYELTEEDIDEERCEYVKRREVRWLKDIYRNDLDPLLFKMFQTHHTIVNAENYADVIDRTLENIYIKDNIAHLKIDVKTKDNIKGKKLYMLQKMVFDSKLEVSDDLEMKINVQSPGFLELITTNLWDVIKISFAVSIILGGGKGFGIEIPGLISIFNKLNENRREDKKLELEQQKEIYVEIKEMYGDSLKSLNVESPNIFLKEIKFVGDSLNPEISTDESRENNSEN